MSECEHKEFFTDSDFYPQALCVDCGYSILIDPFNNTATTHSKSAIYMGHWSEDYQFIYQDCT